MALHNYHEHHQQFPPAYMLGSDGNPWHSWRVLILPELGEQELFDAYRFDEPWNGPHNAQLAQRIPEVFGFSGEPAAKSLGVIGQYTAWPNQASSRFREFQNGTSNSILVVECADSDINWPEPRDIAFAEAMKRRNAATAPRLAGRYAETQILLADGEPHSLKEWVDDRTLSRLLRVGPTGETRSAPPADFPPQQDASAFARTDVLPIPTMRLRRRPRRSASSTSTARISYYFENYNRPNPTLLSGSLTQN